MLEAPRLDPAVEIEARRQIAEHAAAHHEQPERRLAVEAEHRQDEERRQRQARPPAPRGRGRNRPRRADRRCRPASGGGAAPSCPCCRPTNNAWSCSRRASAPPAARNSAASAGRRRASSSRPTRAARRRTASRARMPIITAKASVPAARKISTLSIVAALSPNRLRLHACVHRSDLEVDHLEHDQIADQPSSRRRRTAALWSGARARPRRRNPAR